MSKLNRRDFIKTGVVAVGSVGIMEVAPSLAAADSEPAFDSPNGATGDNRPAAYLHRVQGERFLPKPPSPGRTYSISPMPPADRVRRGIVPRRGLCSLAPADVVRDTLITGNGSMSVELKGDPYQEQILFHHESLLMPLERQLEAPKVASFFSKFRQMALEGNPDVASLAIQRMSEGPVKPNTEPHPTVPAFLMALESPKDASVKDYLRTLDFESAEVTVFWKDERGEWARKTFASRPDDVVVQSLNAPSGQKVSLRISLRKSPPWTMDSGASWGHDPQRGPTKGVEACDTSQKLSEQRLVYKCLLDPSVDTSGFAGVTRIVLKGGTSRVEDGAVVIEDAESVLLLTRIAHFPQFSEDGVTALQQAVDEISPDYIALLERHRKVHSEMFNRVTVNFGGGSRPELAVEELLSDQRSRPDLSPALLEKLFQMGRHWFIVNSGKYPSIASETNASKDLQTAGAVQGDLHEGLGAYFSWMESIGPDCRTNAKNVFGFRGASYPLYRDKGVGASFYYTPTTPWPYWISAGGVAIRPFWDHYLATGDLDFLRNRAVPAYKDLALFYEDFLTVTDRNGNFIFAPSFSPENTPGVGGASSPTLVNATMDIAVCREVLVNLVQACQVLGIEAEGVSRWKAMLDKMPPYLVEEDGTLKEWAWPTVADRYSHRHVSHLHGVWPGDDIDPDRTPQLARAAKIAVRRRTFDLMSVAVAGETLPAYARCHRALAGARLKDDLLVEIMLRQLMEQGYVGAGLRFSRDPYGGPAPDAHGGLPAIVMEMLLYSRPGVIEVLPALPPSLAKGSIRGMLARTFARIDRLEWDMNARTVDLKITSRRNQAVRLIARHGIEGISASGGVLPEGPKQGAADCLLNLPQGKPVEVHLTLGRRNPGDWVERVWLGVDDNTRR